MTEPEPDAPATVWVPTGIDLFGNPIGYIECDHRAVGHWDDARWSDSPPS